MHDCGSASHALDPDVLNAGDAVVEVSGRDNHVGGEGLVVAVAGAVEVGA